MVKLLLSLLLYCFILPIWIFGCSLCTVEDSSVKISIDFVEKEDKLTSVKIQWEFSPLYSAKTKEIFDTNKNAKLDKEEEAQIAQIFLTQMPQSNYYTSIIIDKEIKKLQKNDIFMTYYDFTEENLKWGYTIKTNKDIKNFQIGFLFEDSTGYYNFILDKFNISSKNFELISQLTPQSTQNSNKNYIIFAFNEKNITSSNQSNQLVLSGLSNNTSIEQKNDMQDVQKEGALLLFKYLLKIKEGLVEAKNGDNIALFWLCVFGFLYGIVHALGPGHGKIIIASYFLGKEKNYLQALKMAGSIAFFHIFSAFLLVFVVYTILDKTLSSYVTNIEATINILFGLVLFVGAFYLFFKSLKNLKRSKTTTNSTLSPTSNGQIFHAQKPSNHIYDRSIVNQFTLSAPIIPSTPNQNSLTFSTKKRNLVNKKLDKTDIGVAFLSGAIPCPGTVVVFGTVFAIGAYAAGFLAAISISLGMGLTISLWGMFSIFIKNRAKKSFESFAKFAQSFAYLLISFAGILMIIAGLS